MNSRNVSIPFFTTDNQARKNISKHLGPSVSVESTKYSKRFSIKVKPRFLNMNATILELKKEEFSKLRDSNENFKYNYTQYKNETKSKSICEYNPEFLNDTIDENLIKIYKNRGYNIPKITNTKDLFKNTPANMKKFEINNFYLKKQNSRNREINFDDDKSCKYLDKINYLVQRAKNEYIHEKFLKRYGNKSNSNKQKTIQIPKNTEKKTQPISYSTKTPFQLNSKKKNFSTEMEEMKKYKNSMDRTISSLNNKHDRRSIILKTENSSKIRKQLFNNAILNPNKYQKKNYCITSRVNNISSLYQTKSIFRDNISDSNKTKYNNVDSSMDTNFKTNAFSYFTKNSEDENKYKKISELYEKINKKMNCDNDKDFMDAFYKYFSEYKDLSKEEVSHALKGSSEPMYIFNFFNKLNEIIKDKDEEKKWRKNYLSVGKLGDQKLLFKKMGKCDNLIKHFPQIYIRNIKGVKESKDFCI